MNLTRTREKPRTRPALFKFVLLGVVFLLARDPAASRGPLGVVRWATAEALQLRIWSGFDGNPSIDSEDSPTLAIREALDGWTRLSAFAPSLTPTDLSIAGRDGVSLVTIADEAANRSLVGDFLGTTLYWTQTTGQSSTVVETDVVFNPRPERPWSTVEREDRYSLFDVAQHEFGHVAGLGHSISRGSRLFVFSGDFDYGRGLIGGADFAAINRLFPLPGLDLITGSITGRVTKNGAPLYGGFVLAVDESGILAASDITGQNGSYRLQFLPPGRYAVYVEPLDGPTTPDNLADANVNSGLVDSDFQPRFFQDSMQPQVVVQAGAVASSVNLAVAPGSTPIDPDFIGVNPDANGTLLVYTLPATVPTSARTNVILAGKGSGRLSNDGAFILGDRLRAGPLQRTATNVDGIVFKVYPLDSSADSPSGNYTVALRGGASVGVISGGLKVFPSDRFRQVFSQFVAVPGVARSKLLLFNPDPARDVTGILTTRDQDGVKGSLPLGGTDFHLAPGALLVEETSGATLFQGSLRADADLPTGSVLLVETSAGTTGLGAGRALQSFVAPVEVGASGLSINTGVALTNLDPRPAKIFLRLQNANGVPQGSTTFDLPGNGQTAKLVGEWIPLPGPDFRGTLLATANRRIGATVIRLTPNVFTTFPVIERSLPGKRYFAQFANRGDLSSDLLLVNPSSAESASDVRILARGADGRPAPVTLNGVLRPTGNLTVQIPPLGLVKLSSAGGGDFVGSIEVASATSVGGIALFRSPDFGTAGVGESEPSRRLVLPIDRDQSAGSDTGVAVFNTETRTVLATLTVRDGAGHVVAGPKAIPLQANRQFASFLGQSPLQLELPSTFTGTLWIEGDGELAATAIRQSPGVLTTFPALSRELYLTPR